VVNSKLPGLSGGLKIWHTLKYYIVGLYHRGEQDNATLLAGSLAFSTFVCIVPLVLIIFSIAGLLLETLPLENRIYSVINRIIPYPAYANYVKDLLHSQIAEFRLYKSLAGILGIGGLLLAASGLFGTMRTTLNAIFRLQGGKSPFWGKFQDMGKNMGLVILVMFYFLLSTTLLPALSILKEYSQRNEFLNFFRMGLPGDLITWILGFAMIFASFFLMYFMIPKITLPKKVILISSLCAAILWEIAKQLFGLYVTRIAGMTKIYSVYALVVILSSWIYYTAIVFIISAEIGQLYRESKPSGESVQHLDS
jgi:membrane protein